VRLQLCRGCHCGGASEPWIERFAIMVVTWALRSRLSMTCLIWRDEQTVGKSLGTDLEQHKLTLPLIRVLDVAAPSDRRDVLSILEREGNHRQEALTPSSADTTLLPILIK